MNIVINAYLDNNIGDDLMVRELSRYFFEDSIFIEVNNSILKQPFKDIDNIHFFESKHKKKILSTSDLHVTIGGSLYNLSSIKNCLFFISRIRLARYLKKKKVPSVVIGCNLGPFDKKNFGFFLAKKELKYKELVTVRDLESYDMLRRQKIISNKTFCFPDIIFSLNSKGGKAKLKKEKYGLGISAYRSLNNQVDNYEVYIELSKLADDFILRTGKNVALFAFDCENENDLIAAHYIKYYSKYPNKIKIIPYLGNTDEFLSIFSSCEKMIAIRFHSAVLSGVFDIPFWAISYSNKMINLVKDNGGEEYLCGINELSNYKEIIAEKIINNDLFKFNNSGDLAEKSKGHFDMVKKIRDRII